MKSAILILTVAALCLTARGVSLSAGCDARHGIYFPGQRVTLIFTARELRQPLEFSLRITDEFDRELHSESRPVEPDADGNWSVSIEAPAPRLGFTGSTRNSPTVRRFLPFRAVRRAASLMR